MTPKVWEEPEWQDMYPGCHTHASGFDYLPSYNPADKEIDMLWKLELDQARITLLRTLLSIKT